MKNYSKPEIEIIKFSVDSKIMSELEPMPTPTIMPSNVVLSANDNQMYAPEDVDKKVWAEYGEGTDWTWEAK